MIRRPSLLFYCQHSVGMGHLVRSLALIGALADHFDVAFVSGGAMPPGVRLPAGVRLVQLPPLGMDGEGRLFSRDCRRTVESALAERARRLLEAYRAQRPRVMIVELFPFGRRKFLPELEPVLEAARLAGSRRTLVFSSLRDILVSRHPEREAQVLELLGRYFHGVLVHSDPSFARLEDSFGGNIGGRMPVLYTGFVHAAGAPASPPDRLPDGAIVVSAGGGMVGESLLRCAVEAHALLPAGGRPPLAVLAGPFLPRPAWRALRALVTNRDGIHLRRSVANLSGTLARALGSISQCGYNTAMDLLDSRVPALVVPFGDGSEDEQLKRARRLEALDLVRVLVPAALTPVRLAAEMARLPGFRPPPAALDMNGAACTARLLTRMSQSTPAHEVRTLDPALEVRS